MRRAEFGDDGQIAVLVDDPRHSLQDFEFRAFDVDLDDVHTLAHRYDVIERNHVHLDRLYTVARQLRGRLKRAVTDDGSDVKPASFMSSAGSLASRQHAAAQTVHDQSALEKLE